MAAVKNILKHVSSDVAGRRRKCYRKDTHVILKGDPCLVVRDGPQNQSTYCTVCASDILAKASEALGDLQRRLTPPNAGGSKG